ncbi:tetratricopeptide repeat protein [Luteitalea sp. TBR-22]|uniref:tetratricopeptide repeat protein n=1 Tax=Luteitalea sp. TBR-22 TaxID=2802971 RepID=UPI001AF4151F|nr:tetratricopeptide repeat protein [Luteitalea sp. TBR-22]
MAGAVPARAAGVAWEAAVDRYLAGDRAGAGQVLLQAPAREVTQGARDAYQSWRIPPGSGDDVRRLVIRRLEASALLPLEVLIVSGRSMSATHETALEDAARDAIDRLDPFDEGEEARAVSVRAFREWARLAWLQYLVGASRFLDFQREQKNTRPPAGADGVAALSLLRGVAIETRARLADEAPSASVAMSQRRLPPTSRVPGMLIAFEEAGRHFQKALDARPEDREAVLHLGRLAFERERHDEAERVLAPLLEQPCRDAICGLAHLFMGEVAEARKQPDRAAGFYAKASAVAAVRQTALVAMMQSSMRRGQAGGAYDLTRQFASPAALAPRQPADAWSQYIGGRLAQADLVLVHLLTGVLP